MIEERRPPVRPARTLDEKRKHALSELDRAILADLGQPVINHRISEPHPDLSPIVGNRQFRQGWGDFFGDHSLGQAG
jgi:hypothetical protein